MENTIKEQQLDLFSDRTSASRFAANQLRLLFSAFASILFGALRRMLQPVARATAGRRGPEAGHRSIDDPPRSQRSSVAFPLGTIGPGVPRTGRVAWMCTCCPSPMAIEACRDRGSLVSSILGYVRLISRSGSRGRPGLLGANGGDPLSPNCPATYRRLLLKGVQVGSGGEARTAAHAQGDGQGMEAEADRRAAGALQP